mmetsp:Transcript_118987/g.331972  ORF Transcript_118987/g.331972 Transcript_118987/m.331972 type:complete len:217 (-) Transcript_118987:138-788(-)
MTWSSATRGLRSSNAGSCGHAAGGSSRCVWTRTRNISQRRCSKLCSIRVCCPIIRVGWSSLTSVARRSGCCVKLTRMRIWSTWMLRRGLVSLGGCPRFGPRSGSPATRRSMTRRKRRRTTRVCPCSATMREISGVASPRPARSSSGGSSRSRAAMPQHRRSARTTSPTTVGTPSKRRTCCARCSRRCELALSETSLASYYRSVQVPRADPLTRRSC